MKLFRKKEKRSENTGKGEAAGGILTAFFGKNAVITKEQALEIPTVASCVSLIAERIAALPVKLYRQDGKKVTEILEDKRLDMLNHDTGDTINASEMKKLWVRDYFLSKGSYTYIERNMYNELTAIYYVDESRVAIVPNSDPIHKTYAVQVSGRTFFPYEFIKILRFSKGYGTGRSIIDENPLALAIFYNTMKFENATIRKGGNKRGFLKAQSTVDKNAMDKLREAWQALYSNSNDSADNIVILNNGIDFKEASSTSVELQLNENKQTNAAEICKLFCMPVELLNGKATETQVSQFVQNCLMPAINTIEAALDHDLLTEAEKNGHYYFGIDTDELTRGDFATRMNAYAVAYEHNFYQLDEIREKEDLPPLGFNYIRLGLDSVLLDPKTGQIYTPNTDKMAMLNTGNLLTNDELRAILEERYNPYHDPTNGRFTTADMGGWGSGAALYVGKGEAGSGKYIFDKDKASVLSVGSWKGKSAENYNSLSKTEEGKGKIKTAEKYRERLSQKLSEKSEKTGEIYSEPDYSLDEYGNLHFEYTGKAIKVKEKGGKMISPDKADIIEVTSQYYGTVFTSPDGKGKSESHSKTLSEKVIKAGKRALPVGDEISDLTDEDICDILESRGNPNHDPKTGRFTSGGGATTTMLTKESTSDVLHLPDIEIGRSLSAKAKNYEVDDLRTGEKFYFAEGTHLQNVEVFAGKGTSTVYRNAYKYANRHGGEPEEWQHVKATGVIDYYGENRKAEVHWSQHDVYGKHDFFVKEWLE